MTYGHVVEVVNTIVPARNRRRPARVYQSHTQWCGPPLSTQGEQEE